MDNAYAFQTLIALKLPSPTERLVVFSQLLARILENRRFTVRMITLGVNSVPSLHTT